MTVDYKELSADNINIEKTASPMEFSQPSELPANHHTDHMVEVDWSSEHGWATPQIKPFGNISLDPRSSVLHYATSCFEGLKGYKSADGKSVRLFRPWDNVARLNDSAERICLPQVEPKAAEALIEKLLAIEERFISPGGFIYIRPYLIGTNGALGITTPTEAKFIIVLTLMPSFSVKPLKLYSSPPDAIRAWKGGFGYAKLGANYGPTLKENKAALAKGYTQVLWLLGDEGIVTEAGGSNFFAVMKNKETGRTQILTCPLKSGVILPGITRRSVLELLQEKFADEADVLEQEFTVKDLEDAAKDGRLVEAFAAGTAYFISPVEEILTPEGNTITIPLGDEKTTGSFYGKYSSYAKDYLSSIMWGDNTSHKWYSGVSIEN